MSTSGIDDGVPTWEHVEYASPPEDGYDSSTTSDGGSGSTTPRPTLASTPRARPMSDGGSGQTTPRPVFTKGPFCGGHLNSLASSVLERAVSPQSLSTDGPVLEKSVSPQSLSTNGSVPRMVTQRANGEWVSAVYHFEAAARPGTAPDPFEGFSELGNALRAALPTPDPFEGFSDPGSVPRPALPADDSRKKMDPAREQMRVREIIETWMEGFTRLDATQQLLRAQEIINAWNDGFDGFGASFPLTIQGVMPAPEPEPARGHSLTFYSSSNHAVNNSHCSLDEVMSEDSEDRPVPPTIFEWARNNPLRDPSLLHRFLQDGRMRQNPWYSFLPEHVQPHGLKYAVKYIRTAIDNYISLTHRERRLRRAAKETYKRYFDVIRKTRNVPDSLVIFGNWMPATSRQAQKAFHKYVHLEAIEVELEDWYMHRDNCRDRLEAFWDAQAKIKSLKKKMIKVQIAADNALAHAYDEQAWQWDCFY